MALDARQEGGPRCTDDFIWWMILVASVLYNIFLKSCVDLGRGFHAHLSLCNKINVYAKVGNCPMY